MKISDGKTEAIATIETLNSTASPLLSNRVVLWFLDDSTTGVRRIYIAIVTSIMCGLVWLPYEFLIEFDMLILTLNLPAFLAAFLRLRYLHPDKHRPIRVPGNMFVAVLWTIPPLVLTLGYAYISVFTTNTILFGIPHFNALSYLFLVGTGLVGWAVLHPQEVSRFFRRLFVFRRSSVVRASSRVSSM